MKFGKRCELSMTGLDSSRYKLLRTSCTGPTISHIYQVVHDRRGVCLVVLVAVAGQRVVVVVVHEDVHPVNLVLEGDTLCYRS